MARPRNLPSELLDGPDGGDVGEVSLAPDPLEGYEPTGLRGPETTLTPEKILLAARELARTGILRSAAAKARTTEDCLGQWLRRGKDAAARKKRSLYTQLYMECEHARAHRRGYLINLGERSVTDRHMNPRFVTWLMAVTEPKEFTVTKESAPAQQASGLGPAFEMVTPDAAGQALEEKLRRFLALEDKREALFASIQAENEAEQAGVAASAEEG